MSVQSYLEHLRGKPEHVRSRIAFWSSLGITLVIFAFWAATFSISSTQTDRGTLAASSYRVKPPAESLIAGVGGFFTDITQIFFKPKEIKYAEVEVRAGEK